MSKNRKKRRAKKIKRTSSYETRNRVINPRSFFQRIGIKPLVGPNEERNFSRAEREIVRHFGQDTADTFLKTLGAEGYRDFYFVHSNLGLAKIWYGADFNRICMIATELSQLPVPPRSRVLDIGGGAGHLAFWMAHIWQDCEITVADRFSNLGIEWAKEIGEERVRFADTTLPELELLEEQSYDIIVMSRVLGFMEGLNLPSGMNTYSTEIFFASSEAQRLSYGLEKIADTIVKFLRQDGYVAVVDSWSDFRILMVGRAFERKNLFINSNLFSPKLVGIPYSAIVFSKYVEANPIQDLPLGLSTSVAFSSGPHMFAGTAGESVREFFRDAKPMMMLEYISTDGKIKMKNEILEKEGLALLYRTSTNGSRNAWIFSGIAIPQIIEDLKDMEKDLKSKKIGRILKEVPAKQKEVITTNKIQ